MHVKKAFLGLTLSLLLGSGIVLAADFNKGVYDRRISSCWLTGDVIDEYDLEKSI